MNQEKYSDKEIIDLIGDLENVGHGQNLRVSLCFDINPNEYLYTNVQLFRDAYFNKNHFKPETKLEHMIEYRGLEKDQHVLTISGPSSDVRKIQNDISSFEWIKSDSIEIISEEWIR